jgi:formylmethanofuran dehydrogenase subunit E
MYCPDNYDAFCRHEAEQERALAKLPECSECGHPITSEECFEFNDELICPDCLNDNHKKQTDDFVD